MKKSDLVIFIKEKKKGIYNSIISEYYESIKNTPINLAMILVVKDLKEETGESVELNYGSFAAAYSKMKIKQIRSSGEGQKGSDKTVKIKEDIKLPIRVLPDLKIPEEPVKKEDDKWM